MYAHKLNPLKGNLRRLLFAFGPQRTAGFSTGAAATATGPEPKSIHAIPGPKGWPIVGNLYDMLTKMQDRPFALELAQKYGPVCRLSVGRNNTVVITDPNEAAKVYRAEGKFPLRGYEEKFDWINKKNGIPNSFLNLTGEEWKRLRSTIGKDMLPRRLAESVPGLHKVTQGFVEFIKQKRNSDGAFLDLLPSMQNWSFQGSAFVIVNLKVNVFDEENEAVNKLKKGVVEVIEAIGELSGALPLYKLYPTKAYRIYVSLTKNLRSIGREIMAKKYKEIEEARSAGKEVTGYQGFLEQWMMESKLTDDEAWMMAFDLMGAGIDTTSNSSVFLIYEVAKLPKVQEELHKEVTSVLGDRTTPTFDDLQKMTLVRNCVKETMRLHVPALYGVRQLNEEIEILGYTIPKKTLVLVNFFALSCDPAHFPEPLTFNPDRWKKDKANVVHPFGALPFGIGPRMCLGRRLAELEMYTLLVKMVQSFKMSTNQDSLKTRVSTILKPDEPVNITFTDRM